MKGIIFTVFCELIIENFGEDMLDDIIERSDVPSGGAYTRVGNYDPLEMVALVKATSDITDTPVSELCKFYGNYLFFQFTQIVPEFFNGVKNAYDFLESVDSYIHVEVKKLYNDASPPKILTERIGSSGMTVTYSSLCPFADVAEGLIQGCIEYYRAPITFNAQDIRHDEGYGRQFILTQGA